MRIPTRLLCFFVLSFLLVGVQPAMVWAQTAATISGTVKDETGAVLPGVSVTVKNVDTGSSRPVMTDDAGRYLAPELAPGSYEVQASLDGFQTAVHGGITLTVGRHVLVDMALKVGAVSEKVTVMGEAPLVETTSSSLSGLVGEAQIRDLPLNGRNFVQLTLLETGVTQNRSAGNSSVVGGGLKMSFHGARMDSNNFMMDGTSVNSVNQQAIGGASNQAMGVETIKEFQVLTSNFTAEFGRAGGGVINVVTKSGTNELHGSAFYFHRNDNLDARNFYDRGGPPEFKRNQFGGTIGGPIRQDKTFFFGGYEGLREGLGRTHITNTPTAAARQGNLGSLGQVAVDSRVRPYLDLFPLPNGQDFGDGRGEYITSDTDVTSQDFFQVRLDHNYSDSDSLFVRYTMDDSAKDTPQDIATWLQTDAVRSQYVTIEEKKILSATLLNVARFGFNRTSVAYTQVPLDPRVFDPALWFVTEYSVPGLGPLGVGGLGEVGMASNRPKIRLDNGFEWQDTLSYNAGQHSIKTGVDVQRIQTNEFDSNRGMGTWSFASLSSFLRNAPGQFLAQGVGSGRDWTRGYRQTVFGTFLQDDFRLSPRLTLNVGLRWEFVTSPSEVNGKAAHIPNDDPTTSTTTIVGNPLMILPKDNFAPRIGFAWDPVGNGKTSVRGGFGLFHQLLFRNYYFSARLLPPFITTLSGSPPAVSFPNPLAGTPREEHQVEWVPYGDDNAPNHLPFMLQYNLSLQQEILPSTVITVGYVGSHGTHLPEFVDYNVAVPTILSDGRKFFAQSPAVRRNPFYSQARGKLLIGNSIYNALQFKLTRRVSQGLQFQTSYTFSHSIDNASGQLSGDFNNNTVEPQDPFDLKAERGNSAFDLRHVMVLNFTYDLPLAKNSGGAAGALLRGWQVNGIASLATGVPFTVENAATLDRERDGSTASASRPNLVPGRSNSPVLGGPDKYFDVTAFQLQDAGFYGNLGRDTVFGPGLATFDFALVKNSSIGEGKGVQFRAEIFNLFNRANFGLPDRTVFRAANAPASATAGRITDTTTTSRQVQLGLKITF